MHYNETKDFVDIDAVDRDALRHIDMERAYARFFNCRHYAGFPGKITDFRECRDVNIEFVRDNLGYYLIANLRTDGVDPMKVQMLNHLRIYRTEETLLEDDTLVSVPLTLPSVELVWLHELGATFDILQGCWGTRIDFRFPQEFEDKKDGTCRYYSKWTGQQKSFQTHSKIYMAGTEAFFGNILSHMRDKQAGLPTEQKTRVKYFLEDEQTWEGLPYKSKPRIRKEGDPAPVQQGTPHCEVFDTSEPADLKKYNELLLKIAAHSSYALISTDKTFSQQSNGYILMVHWTAYYFVEAEDINK